MPKKILGLLVAALGLFGCAMAFVKPLAEPKTAELDGAKLEYAVAGAGQPAVVFLNGYGAVMDISWSKVFPEIAKTNTVLAYNRFNYGDSATVEAPQTGAAVADALHHLLRAAGLAPPYVLVGHSLGGVYAQVFARQHPAEVAGVVLVDSSHPEQEEMRRKLKSDLGSRIGDAIFWFDSAFNPRRHSEIAMLSETHRQIQAGPAFPDIPLIVISAGKEPPSWLVGEEFMQLFKTNQRRLASLSPQGRQVIATRSGHFVQNDQPEIVIQAIRDVIEQSRAGQPGRTNEENRAGVSSSP